MEWRVWRPLLMSRQRVCCGNTHYQALSKSALESFLASAKGIRSCPKSAAKSGRYCCSSHIRWWRNFGIRLRGINSTWFLPPLPHEVISQQSPSRSLRFAEDCRINRQHQRLRAQGDCVNVEHAVSSLPARSTRPISLLKPLSSDYTHGQCLRVLLTCPNTTREAPAPGASPNRFTVSALPSTSVTRVIGRWRFAAGWSGHPLLRGFQAPVWCDRNIGGVSSGTRAKA